MPAFTWRDINMGCKISPKYCLASLLCRRQNVRHVLENVYCTSFDHALRTRLESSALTIAHRWSRKMRNRICLLGCSSALYVLLLFFRDDEDMNIWEPSVPKLNDPDVSHHFCEGMLLEKVVEKGVQFEFEHAGSNFWSIRGRSSEKDRFLDFFPLRIGGHKEIRLLISLNNRESILVFCNQLRGLPVWDAGKMMLRPWGPPSASSVIKIVRSCCEKCPLGAELDSLW